MSSDLEDGEIIDGAPEASSNQTSHKRRRPRRRPRNDDARNPERGKAGNTQSDKSDREGGRKNRSERSRENSSVRSEHSSHQSSSSTIRNGLQASSSHSTSRLNTTAGISSAPSSSNSTTSSVPRIRRLQSEASILSDIPSSVAPPGPSSRTSNKTTSAPPLNQSQQGGAVVPPSAPQNAASTSSSSHARLIDGRDTARTSKTRKTKSKSNVNDGRDTRKTGKTGKTKSKSKVNDDLEAVSDSDCSIISLPLPEKPIPELITLETDSETEDEKNVGDEEAEALAELELRKSILEKFLEKAAPSQRQPSVGETNYESAGMSMSSDDDEFQGEQFQPRIIPSSPPPPPAPAPRNIQEITNISLPYSQPSIRPARLNPTGLVPNPASTRYRITPQIPLEGGSNNTSPDLPSMFLRRETSMPNSHQETNWDLNPAMTSSERIRASFVPLQSLNQNAEPAAFSRRSPTVTVYNYGHGLHPATVTVQGLSSSTLVRDNEMCYNENANQHVYEGSSAMSGGYLPGTGVQYPIPISSTRDSPGYVRRNDVIPSPAVEGGSSSSSSNTHSLDVDMRDQIFLPAGGVFPHTLEEPLILSPILPVFTADPRTDNYFATPTSSSGTFGSSMPTTSFLDHHPMAENYVIKPPATGTTPMSTFDYQFQSQLMPVPKLNVQFGPSYTSTPKPVPAPPAFSSTPLPVPPPLPNAPIPVLASLMKSSTPVPDPFTIPPVPVPVVSAPFTIPSIPAPSVSVPLTIPPTPVPAPMMKASSPVPIPFMKASTPVPAPCMIQPVPVPAVSAPFTIPSVSAPLTIPPTPVPAPLKASTPVPASFTISPAPVPAVTAPIAIPAIPVPPVSAPLTTSPKSTNAKVLPPCPPAPIIRYTSSEIAPLQLETSSPPPPPPVARQSPPKSVNSPPPPVLPGGVDSERPAKRTTAVVKKGAKSSQEHPPATTSRAKNSNDRLPYRVTSNKSKPSDSHSNNRHSRRSPSEFVSLSSRKTDTRHTHGHYSRNRSKSTDRNLGSRAVGDNGRSDGAHRNRSRERRQSGDYGRRRDLSFNNDDRSSGKYRRLSGDASSRERRRSGDYGRRRDLSSNNDDHTSGKYRRLSGDGNPSEWNHRRAVERSRESLNLDFQDNNQERPSGYRPRRSRSREREVRGRRRRISGTSPDRTKDRATLIGRYRGRSNSDTRRAARSRSRERARQQHLRHQKDMREEMYRTRRPISVHEVDRDYSDREVSVEDIDSGDQLEFQDIVLSDEIEFDDENLELDDDETSETEEKAGDLLYSPIQSPEFRTPDVSVGNRIEQQNTLDDTLDDEEELRAKLLIEVSRKRLVNDPILALQAKAALQQKDLPSTSSPRPTLTVFNPVDRRVVRYVDNTYRSPTPVPHGRLTTPFSSPIGYNSPIIQRTIINQHATPSKRTVRLHSPSAGTMIRLKPIQPVVINLRAQSSSEEEGSSAIEKAQVSKPQILTKRKSNIMSRLGPYYVSPEKKKTEKERKIEEMLSERDSETSGQEQTPLTSPARSLPNFVKGLFTPSPKPDLGDTQNKMTTEADSANNAEINQVSNQFQSSKKVTPVRRKQSAGVVKNRTDSEKQLLETVTEEQGVETQAGSTAETQKSQGTDLEIVNQKSTTETQRKEGDEEAVSNVESEVAQDEREVTADPDNQTQQGGIIQQKPEMKVKNGQNKKKVPKKKKVDPKVSEKQNAFPKLVKTVKKKVSGLFKSKTSATSMTSKPKPKPQQTGPSVSVPAILETQSESRSSSPDVVEIDADGNPLPNIETGTGQLPPQQPIRPGKTEESLPIPPQGNTGTKIKRKRSWLCRIPPDSDPCSKNKAKKSATVAGTGKRRSKFKVSSKAAGLTPSPKKLAGASTRRIIAAKKRKTAPISNLQTSSLATLPNSTSTNATEKAHTLSGIPVPPAPVSSNTGSTVEIVTSAGQQPRVPEKKSTAPSLVDNSRSTPSSGHKSDTNIPVSPAPTSTTSILTKPNFTITVSKHRPMTETNDRIVTFANANVNSSSTNMSSPVATTQVNNLPALSTLPKIISLAKTASLATAVTKPCQPSGQNSRVTLAKVLHPDLLPASPAIRTKSLPNPCTSNSRIQFGSPAPKDALPITPTVQRQVITFTAKPTTALLPRSSPSSANSLPTSPLKSKASSLQGCPVPSLGNVARMLSPRAMTGDRPAGSSRRIMVPKAMMSLPKHMQGEYVVLKTKLLEHQSQQEAQGQLTSKSISGSGCTTPARPSSPQQKTTPVSSPNASASSRMSMGRPSPENRGSISPLTSGSSRAQLSGNRVVHSTPHTMINLSTGKQKVKKSIPHMSEDEISAEAAVEFILQGVSSPKKLTPVSSPRSLSSAASSGPRGNTENTTFSESEASEMSSASNLDSNDPDESLSQEEPTPKRRIRQEWILRESLLKASLARTTSNYPFLLKTCEDRLVKKRTESIAYLDSWLERRADLNLKKTLKIGLVQQLVDLREELRRQEEVVAKAEVVVKNLETDLDSQVDTIFVLEKDCSELESNCMDYGQRTNEADDYIPPDEAQAEELKQKLEQFMAQNGGRTAKPVAKTRPIKFRYFTNEPTDMQLESYVPPSEYGDVLPGLDPPYVPGGGDEYISPLDIIAELNDGSSGNQRRTQTPNEVALGLIDGRAGSPMSNSSVRAEFCSPAKTTTPRSCPKTT